jgi:hypothetical protein
MRIRGQENDLWSVTLLAYQQPLAEGGPHNVLSIRIVIMGLGQS